jgi:N-glycosylase/DNA lyase
MSGLGSNEVEEDLQSLLGRERTVVTTIRLVGFLVRAELSRFADHPLIIPRAVDEGIRKRETGLLCHPCVAKTILPLEAALWEPPYLL